MNEQRKSVVQALVIGLLLVLSLPLFYLLFAKVLIPMAWNEDSLKLEETSFRSDGPAHAPLELIITHT